VVGAALQFPRVDACTVATLRTTGWTWFATTAAMLVVESDVDAGEIAASKSWLLMARLIATAAMDRVVSGIDAAAAATRQPRPDARPTATILALAGVVVQDQGRVAATADLAAAAGDAWQAHFGRVWAAGKAFGGAGRSQRSSAEPLRGTARELDAHLAVGAARRVDIGMLVIRLVDTELGPCLPTQLALVLAKFDLRLVAVPLRDGGAEAATARCRRVRGRFVLLLSLVLIVPLLPVFPIPAAFASALSLAFAFLLILGRNGARNGAVDEACDRRCHRAQQWPAWLFPNQRRVQRVEPMVLHDMLLRRARARADRHEGQARPGCHPGAPSVSGSTAALA
jgi:hypothetical protein